MITKNSQQELSGAPRQLQRPPRSPIWSGSVTAQEAADVRLFTGPAPDFFGMDDGATGLHLHPSIRAAYPQSSRAEVGQGLSPRGGKSVPGEYLPTYI